MTTIQDVLYRLGQIEKQSAYVTCRLTEMGFSGYSGFSGATGPQGLDGTTAGSGFSGYSGSIGLSGFSGLGVSGYSGYSGIGIEGVSGYSGQAGPIGISGYSGSGISGFSGYSGANGISGFSGQIGLSTSGYSGYSGVSTSGFSGYSGIGISGYSGIIGADGLSGYSGFSGYSGSGLSGYSGTIGQTGISGFSGASTSGYSGYSGSGYSGYSGSNGSIGVSGYSGFSGSGISGYSGLGFSGYSGFSGAAGGGGDVTKVGTPVDNQIGVWTGNGTMEGDANLTFDGSTKTLAVSGTGAGGTALNLGSSFNGIHNFSIGITNFLYNMQTYRTGLTIGSDFDLTLSILNTSGGDGNIIFKKNSGGGTEWGRFTSTGFGIRTASPTARLHLPAGTATANTAPLKFTSGTALTTPENGTIEYHSSHLYFTTGGVRYSLDQPQFFTPANSTDSTYANGTMAFDDDFMYYRTSSGTWKKVALGAF